MDLVALFCQIMTGTEVITGNGCVMDREYTYLETVADMTASIKKV